jgi:Uma2 family endonuclease
MTQAVLTLPDAQPAQGEWTYEDYRKLPNDGRRYEIIEGVLYVANAPDADHQFTVTEISAELRNFVKQHRLGRVLVAPFEVHLTPRSRPVQPDVLFVSAARWPQGRVAYFDGAPDLVVEVISPSRVRVDRVIKFTAYEAAGVREYWIVNSRARTIEIYVLENGEYGLLGEFSGDEQIQSTVLEGIEIAAGTLFP